MHEGTEDFFIDVTGWDIRACESCLLLVCLSLAERGGMVESIELTESNNECVRVPNGEARKHRVPDSLIRKILGLDLDSEELSRAIAKMGGRLEASQTVTDGPHERGRWADCVVGEIEHIICMEKGWRFTPRLHISLFGNAWGI